MSVLVLELPGEPRWTFDSLHSGINLKLGSADARPWSRGRRAEQNVRLDSQKPAFIPEPSDRNVGTASAVTRRPRLSQRLQIESFFFLPGHRSAKSRKDKESEAGEEQKRKQSCAVGYRFRFSQNHHYRLVK